MIYALNDADERVRAEAADEIGDQLRKNPCCCSQNVIAALTAALGDCDKKDRSRSIGELLAEREQLSTEHLQLLETVLADHLERNGDDVQQSLAALSPTASLQMQEDQRSKSDLNVGSTFIPNVGSTVVAETTEGGPETGTYSGPRYRIRRAHAHGGLGEVYLAEDRELHRDVALKEIRKELAEDANCRNRFILEAEITGGLEHPGIVPVYGLGQYNDGRPFYAMRFIQGDNLKEAIRRYHEGAGEKPEAGERNLSFRELLGRFVDVCQAVAYAHSRGVLHRDLKPDNIMLGKFGETLLVDWGLAKTVGRDDLPFGNDEHPLQPASGDQLAQTQMGSAVGTPSYMSPEQAAGHLDKLGPASDIYSLGATLYVILTGQSPFRGSVADKLKLVQQGDFAAPRKVNPDVPAAVEAICLKAMSRDADQRYETALQLAEDIENFLADAPVSAHDEPATVRARRWMRKHPRAMAGLAASILVGLCAAILSTSVVSAKNRELATTNHELDDANQQLAQSNADLEQANDAEHEAKGVAESRRQEAELQFDLAMSAIRNYHTKIAGDFLLAQSEFRELRSSLLKAPRSFYGDLIARLEKKSEPGRRQREALFDAHTDLAMVTSDLEEYEATSQLLTTALSINARLVAADETNIDYKQKRVEVLLKLASLHVNAGQTDESAKALDAAETIIAAIGDQAPNSSEFDWTRTKLLSQRARLFSQQNQLAEADKCFAEVMKITHRLMEAEPENRTYLWEHSGRLNDYGTLLSNLGKRKQAKERTLESVRLCQKLLEQEPKSAETIYRLSSALTNLAYILQEDKQFDEAIKAYQRSEPLFRTLVEQGSNVTRFQSGLASTLNNLGLLHAELKQFDIAETKYRETLVIKERLVRDYPHLVEHQVSLGGGYTNFGNFFRQQKKDADALQWYGRALGVLNGVLKENPRNTIAHFFSRNTLKNRAGAYRILRKYAEAARDFEAACRHHPSAAERRSLQNQLAQTLAQSGQHQQAMQLTAEFTKSAKTDRDFFNIAFIRSLAVAAAKQDKSLSAAKRKKTLSDYTARAVESLRAMYATDAVPRKIFLEVLKNNHYINGLRGQPEFDRLLREFDSTPKSKPTPDPKL
eukprot:g26676.t1